MLILDVFMVVMMFITIGFCWKLNNKIIAIQKDKSELAKLFKYFDNSLARAEHGINELRETSQKVSSQLIRKIELAKELIDDMAAMQLKSQDMHKVLEKSVLESNEQLRKLHKTLQDYEKLLANKEIAEKAVPSKEEISREIQKIFNQAAEEQEKSYIGKRIVHRSSDTKHNQKIAIETLLKKISEVNGA